MPAELEAGLATTGSSSTRESLALLSAGSTRLILPKHTTPIVTVAIAAVIGGGELGGA